MTPLRLARLLLLVMLLPASPARADDERDALEWLRQGIELFQKDRLEEARLAFRRATELAPGRANPFRWLALTSARLGDCKGAIVAVEQFLALAPKGDPRIADAVTLRDTCRKERPAAAGASAQPAATTAVAAAKAPAPPPTATEPVPAAALPAADAAATSDKPPSRRWVWGVVGGVGAAVVIAAVVGGVLGAQASSSSPPSTTLGGFTPVLP